MTNLLTLRNQMSANRVTFELPGERGLTQLVSIASRGIDPAFTIAGKPCMPSQAGPQADYRDAAARVFQPSSGLAPRLFVTSPSRGDGKTCTAFNLAWALARLGKPVLLAELNFSSPRLRAALGNLRPRYGIENALRGWVKPEEAIFALTSTSLQIATVRNPVHSDSLAPVLAHLADFFNWAGDRYAHVVFDCPAVLSQDWKDWFHAFAGPSLLVVREDHTPLVEIQQAAKKLGGHLKGVLLNGAREAQPSHHLAPALGPTLHRPSATAGGSLRTGS